MRSDFILLFAVSVCLMFLILLVVPRFRMGRRATVSLISVMGLLTVLHFYLILGYGEQGFRSEPVEPVSLAMSALPTALFLAASFLCPSSGKMQLVVAAAAALVGILCVGVIRSELAHPSGPSRTGPGMGFLSIMAWLFGLAVAVGVVLSATGVAVWQRFRRK